MTDDTSRSGCSFGPYRKNTRPHAALRPVCSAIGLHHQVQRLLARPVHRVRHGRGQLLRAVAVAPVVLVGGPASDNAPAALCAELPNQLEARRDPGEILRRRDQLAWHHVPGEMQQMRRCDVFDQPGRHRRARADRPGAMSHPSPTPAAAGSRRHGPRSRAPAAAPGSAVR